MNRRIAMSALSILSTLALTGGAAFAFFSDTNTSTGNTFSAGTLNLQLDDENEAFTSGSVTSSLTGTNLAPNATSDLGFISLHNSGTIAMAEVELGVDKTADDADAFLLEDVLDLTVTTGSDSTCAGGTDQTPSIAAVVGNLLMPLTLSELVASDYDALPGLAAENAGTTDEYYVCFDATMKASAGNDYQGDTATFTFSFTGNQDASQ